MLANEGHCIDLCTGIVVGANESDVLDPVCHRSPGWGVFLTSHFTLPPSIGTLVASGVKDKGVAAVHLAVAQYQDATNFTVRSIERNGSQRIESIPNHVFPHAVRETISDCSNVA
jgi:hypothetical protein